MGVVGSSACRTAASSGWLLAIQQWSWSSSKLGGWENVLYVERAYKGTSGLVAL
jgi:hypothetical protein